MLHCEYREGAGGTPNWPILLGNGFPESKTKQISSNKSELGTPISGGVNKFLASSRARCVMLPELQCSAYLNVGSLVALGTARSPVVLRERSSCMARFVCGAVGRVAITGIRDNKRCVCSTLLFRAPQVAPVLYSHNIPMLGLRVCGSHIKCPDPCTHQTPKYPCRCIR